MTGVQGAGIGLLLTGIIITMVLIAFYPLFGPTATAAGWLVNIIVILTGFVATIWID